MLVGAYYSIIVREQDVPTTKINENDYIFQKMMSPQSPKYEAILIIFPPIIEGWGYLHF